MTLPASWRRFPLLTVLLLGWLGGGLLSAAVAVFIDGQNDLLYAAVNVTGALLALSLLPVAGRRPRLGRSARSPHRTHPGPERATSSTAAAVPAQSTSGPDDRVGTGRALEPAANHRRQP